MGLNEWDVHHHDRPERHEFGKTFGIPTRPVFSTGVSQIPAREDHEHGAAASNDDEIIVFKQLSFNVPSLMTADRSDTTRFVVAGEVYKYYVEIDSATLGSTNGVIAIFKNSVSVDSVTLTAGQNFVSKTLTTPIATTITDEWFVGVTTVATGAGTPQVLLHKRIV